MNVISLKEYAQINSISYEAVRQQVVRYATELEGHIIKDGRQQFLDDVAVAFLDGKRQKNPVVIYQVSKDEELAQLRAEKEALLIELNGAKSRIIEQQDKLYELAGADQKIQLLEASSKTSEERAVKAEARASEREREIHELEVALEGARENARFQAEAVLAADGRCDEAEERASKLQAQLDQLVYASLRDRWKLRKALKKQRKKEE